MANPFPMIESAIGLTQPEAFLPKSYHKTAEDSIKQLDAMEEALQRVRDIETFATENPEITRKVTGPIMGAVMGGSLGTTIPSLISAYGDEDYNAGRQLSGKILEAMNPTRKAVTGAQASYQELARMISPIFPQMTDSYENLIRNSREFQYRSVNAIRSQMEALRQMGFQPEKYMRPSTNEFLNMFDQMKEPVRKAYFFQKKEQ